MKIETSPQEEGAAIATAPPLSRGLRQRGLALSQELNYPMGLTLLACWSLGWLALSTRLADHLVAAYCRLLAEICSSLLNLLGEDTLVSGDNVYNSHFTATIFNSCSGVGFEGMLAISILCAPVKISLRMAGLMTVLPLQFVVNMVRMVVLFVLGTHSIASFHFAHDWIWPFVTLVFGLGSIFIWAAWVRLYEK